MTARAVGESEQGRATCNRHRHRRAGHSRALKESKLECHPGLFKKEFVKTRKGNMSFRKVTKGGDSLILAGGQGTSKALEGQDTGVMRQEKSSWTNRQTDRQTHRWTQGRGESRPHPSLLRLQCEAGNAEQPQTRGSEWSVDLSESSITTRRK